LKKHSSVKIAKFERHALINQGFIVKRHDVYFRDYFSVADLNSVLSLFQVVAYTSAYLIICFRLCVYYINDR